MSVADRLHAVVDEAPNSKYTAGVLLDLLREAADEIGLLRAALHKIDDRSSREHHNYEPSTPRSEYARAWRDGYHTALATCALDAAEALDPVAWAEHETRWHAASCDTDRQWLERTGCCGHCGNVAELCDCTPGDPCGCGPHEVKPWPRECWVCSGSGLIQQHRKVTS